MKYVGIHLGKHIWHLYAKNYKMLVKKTQRTLIGDSSSTTGAAQDPTQAEQERRAEVAATDPWGVGRGEGTDHFGRPWTAWGGGLALHSRVWRPCADLISLVS